MGHYLSDVESHSAKFFYWRVKHIPCEENGKTDALAGVTTILLITEFIMLPIYVQPMSFITSE